MRFCFNPWYVAGIALMAGCATPGSMLPGRMYSLNDGTVLRFSIEVSHAGGAVSAQNEGTGEAFSGAYSPVSDGQVMPGVGSTNASQANAVATLMGSKGTVINCQLFIQRTYTPSGIGKCKDNKRGTYSLTF